MSMQPLGAELTQRLWETFEKAGQSEGTGLSATSRSPVSPQLEAAFRDLMEAPSQSAAVPEVSAPAPEAQLPSPVELYRMQFEVQMPVLQAQLAAAAQNGLSTNLEQTLKNSS